MLESAAAIARVVSEPLVSLPSAAASSTAMAPAVSTVRMPRPSSGSPQRPHEGQPAWMIPSDEPPVADPSVLEANFYVDLVRNSTAPSCCSACQEFFLVGTLCLGFLGARGGSTAAALDDQIAQPTCWIHVPRCLPRANMAVQRSDRVRFSPFVPLYERERVLDELGLQRVRQEVWRLSGLARLAPPPRPARPWRYGLAALQQWPDVPIPEPPPPSAPYHISRNLPFSGLRMPAAAVRTSPPPPPLGPPPQLTPASTDQAEVSEEVLAPLLRRIPAQKLPMISPAYAKRGVDSCTICHEALLPGEEVRRLPCLHVFHRDCIDRWLKIRCTCPLDNQRLDDLLEGRPTAPTPISQPMTLSPSPPVLQSLASLPTVGMQL